MGTAPTVCSCVHFRGCVLLLYTMPGGAVRKICGLSEPIGASVQFYPHPGVQLPLNRAVNLKPLPKESGLVGVLHNKFLLVVAPS